MERLKSMKETLMNCAQGQLGHLDTVDAKELGEVVDMIKDLEEAIYYCTITKSMTEQEHKEKEHHYYYTEYYPEQSRDMDKVHGRMYYPYPMYSEPMYYNGNGSSSNGNSTSGGNNAMGGGTRGYNEYPMTMMRDRREGNSPMSRKMYMEGKEMRRDKASQMKELEKYMQELTKDISEMIEGASAEEKQMLQQKITTLANKI